MLRYHEFDAAEMSLSSYVMSLFSEHPPFIAIPVFPSRSFRHSCIFINRNSGIREPKDLIGKQVGSPEYQLTAPVWIRGILSDEYPRAGLERAIFHRRPGRAGPHRKDKTFVASRDSRRADSTGENAVENARSGEIDALYTPRMPSTFLHGSGSVCGGCLRITARLRESIFRRREFSRSCTRW